MGQIILGDCLEVMKGLDDNSIDMVLCDLPYGTTANKWDTVIPLQPMWEALNRVVKASGAVVLTASTPFDKLLGASNLGQLRYEWIWVKNNCTGHLNAKRQPMKQHENILVFGGKVYNPQGLEPYGKVTKRGHNGTNFGTSGTSNLQEFTNYPKSVLSFDYDKEKLHPTQKPVALFEYLIRTYSNEGDTVLDMTAGSGTTGVAAINTGRDYILIEKDEKYYEIAKGRLAQ